MNTKDTCPDCGTGIGEPHKNECDVERCSVCRGQRISCDCECYDPQASAWTGEWPQPTPTDNKLVRKYVVDDNTDYRQWKQWESCTVLREVLVPSGATEFENNEAMDFEEAARALRDKRYEELLDLDAEREDLVKEMRALENSTKFEQFKRLSAASSHDDLDMGSATDSNEQQL